MVNVTLSIPNELKQKMDCYVHSVYDATKKFPKCERYGVTSQLQRSALSVILNYIEGYARKKIPVRINFLEISFGSLQESKYLLKFSLAEGYMRDEQFQILDDLSNEISKILWSETSTLSKNNQ